MKGNKAKRAIKKKRQESVRPHRSLVTSLAQYRFGAGTRFCMPYGNDHRVLR